MKKLMFALLATMCASIANAAYLYWQVSAGDVDSSITEPWNAARLYEDGRLVTSTQYWNSYNNRLEGDNADAVSAPMGTGYVFDIGSDNTAGHSYYVELWQFSDASDWSSSGHAVAQSQSVSGDALPGVYNDTGTLTTTLLTAPTSMVAWHAGGYRAVPEPTSGLMLLLGAAMLGLKRKNRSIA